MNITLARLLAPRAESVKHGMQHHYVGLGGHEPLGWDPTRTWVFAVNVVDYADKSMVRNPRVRVEGDAMVENFRARGVPDDRIVFLRDKAATLNAVRAAFDAFLWRGIRPRASSGDMLFFYFSGHGGRSTDGTGGGWYCPYDHSGMNTAWHVDEIIDRIDRRFGGNQVIFTAACCYSGSVAEQLSRRMLRKSYAVVASTLATTTSTHSWAFTRCLREGFGGESMVDLDADGNVTLAELGQHAAARMRSIARQQVTFGTFGRLGQLPNGLVLASRSPLEIAGHELAGPAGDTQLVVPRLEVAQYSTAALRTEVSRSPAAPLSTMVSRPQAIPPTRARVTDFGAPRASGTGRARQARS